MVARALILLLLVEFPRSKKPRDSGIVLTDDDGNSSLLVPSQFGSSLRLPDFQPHTPASTQPNPSTSFNSVMSGVTDDSFSTPEFEPSLRSDWPSANEDGVLGQAR